jgi:hypothetical protein
MENSKIDKLLNESYETLEKLRKEVSQLEEIRKGIEDLKAGNDKLPILFQERFNKIVEFSKDYTNTLGASVKKYLHGNNDLFTKKLHELSDKTKELQKEISRLVDTDFIKLFDDLQKGFIEQTQKDLAVEIAKIDDTFVVQLQELSDKTKELQKEISRLVDIDFIKLFDDLQKKFIEQTQKDLAVEIAKIDDSIKDFQTKIDEFAQQITRLEEFDLEKHFEKHQKTLSEIFDAVTSINIILSRITQTLSDITHSLGAIQHTIDINHSETIKQIASFRTETSGHLNNQDDDVKRQFDNLIQQNKLLKKQIKTNLIIEIIGLIVILFILLIFK